MTTPPKKNVELSFIQSGQLERPEDTMCKQCFKPALWVGKTYLVTREGVIPYGRVKGCQDCKVWFYFNRAGDLYLTKGKGVTKGKPNAPD